MKYTDALPAEQHKQMHTFLTLLCVTSDKAKKQGVEKPNIESFLKTYRDIFGRPKDLNISYRDRRRNGLCVHCRKRALPGLAYCEEHRKYHHEYGKRYREEKRREKARG